MGKEAESRSAKVRNYAIAGACLILAFLVGGLALEIFGYGRSSPGITIWSECRERSANVFIGANGNDLRDVRCVALDAEFFAESEIAIGDMSKYDEDVCRFKLMKENATDTQPLRFEVHYNGKVEREVCDWQNNFVGAD